MAGIKSQQKKMESAEEIPGSRDPESVLKQGEIGNFEQIPVVLPPDNPNAEGKNENE